MRRFAIRLAMTLGFVSPSLSAEVGPRLCEPWKSQYQGEDATGKHVIALWTFESEKVADSSGHGHDATLRGAKIHPKGRFGAALESFAGWPVTDNEHAAKVPSRPALSPKGPFTLEMWIQPKPELNAEYGDSFLLDKKYVAHQDYQWILGPADRSGTRVLRVVLGFGEDSSTWYSRPARYEPGVWYHLAFTYNGTGEGSFYLNGLPWGRQQVPGRESMAPGKHPLSIGDRIGSYYHGFPGLIDQVRLSSGVLEFRPAKFERISDRSVFLRMESPAQAKFLVTNLQRSPLAGAAVRLSTGGLAAQETKIEGLAPGASQAVEHTIDTSLRPDTYRVVAELNVPGPNGFQSEEEFAIRIVPRPLPHRFPVLMWGVGSPAGVRKEMDRLKQIGFNHVLGLGADVDAIWEAGKPIAAQKPEAVAEARQMLDEALAEEITVVASLSPGAYAARRPELQRVDRKGQPYKTKTPDVCGLFPQVQKFVYDVGASVAQTYGDHPAFGAAMLHTEVRDHASLCFHPHDLESLRKQAGIELPQQVGGRNGVMYSSLPGFPQDRVIAGDHPLYVFYRWYWKSGDGWNGLNTALHQGLKSTGRRDLWTYHDPAVRVASVYGSGGQSNVLSQWTYSYPDPIRIAVATDELLAMTRGAEHPQHVMKMTQVIWYRGQTAPIPKTPAEALPYRARWEREQPDAPFITIAPMHLREAFWTKIARPIKGIMYHGWQSLVPTDTPGGYCYTHPETQHELARLVREVVRPLGPTLLQVPGVQPEVAFLESFASQMFARRGTYGWGGSWAGDAYLAMLYAHLQPEIVYDETIQGRGLDAYRVLVLADCDVLTKTLAEKIKAFQAKGGLVVGDDRLTPAIKPDIVLAPTQRSGRNDRDKAALLSLAAELRKKLDPRVARYLDSSNPEVIPYLRRLQNTDYVFLVNDRREYGQYVGQHGLVMENGLPSSTQVRIARPAGFVYDLVRGEPVAARTEGGSLRLDLELGPCDGTVLMVTPQAIDRVSINAPEVVARGGKAQVDIAVLDAQGRPIEAVTPLQVSIRDASGRFSERSGYYGASAGRQTIELQIAPNDPFGVWQVEVRELASQRTARRHLRVAGPEPWPPVNKPAPKGAANAVQPLG